MRGREFRNCLYFAVTMTIFLFFVSFVDFWDSTQEIIFEENLGKAQIILNKNTKYVIAPTRDLTLINDGKTTFGKTQT